MSNVSSFISPKRHSTALRHRQIYLSFKQLHAQFQQEVPTKWKTAIGHFAIYSIISEQTGYSEDYVCKIVNQQRRLEDNGR